MKRGPISVLKYALVMFVVLALLIGGSWVFRIPLSEKLKSTSNKLELKFIPSFVRWALPSRILRSKL